MNRQDRKKIMKKAGHGARNVAVVFPPLVYPHVREFKIGRNDPCPCGVNQEKLSIWEEWYTGVMLGIIPENTPAPNDGKIVKYKNHCLATGKFENYKQNRKNEDEGSTN